MTTEHATTRGTDFTLAPPGRYVVRTTDGYEWFDDADFATAGEAEVYAAEVRGLIESGEFGAVDVKVVDTERPTLTADQIRRTRSALVETLDRIEKFSPRRTFDAGQEAEKQKELAFLRRHAETLRSMLGE